MALIKSTCTQVGDESNESYQDTDKINREIFSLTERNWFLQHGSSCHAQKSAKRICIFSIDGGGMRGILTCRYLLYLQNALKKTRLETPMQASQTILTLPPGLIFGE